MRTVNITALFAITAISMVAAGCKNPADGKAEAKTGKAESSREGPLRDATERLALTPQNTKLTWKGSKVTGSHTGSFGKISGQLEARGSDPETARITVDMEMGSLTSDHPKLTGHLKSKDFFDVESYPKARFVSTKIKAGGDKGATHTITGNLTLRGVTKSITFPAEIKVTDKEAQAKAEFWIDRNLWGISFKGMANDLIRKEVVITLEISVPRAGNQRIQK